MLHQEQIFQHTNLSYLISDDLSNIRLSSKKFPLVSNMTLASSPTEEERRLLREYRLITVPSRRSSCSPATSNASSSTTNDLSDHQNLQKPQIITATILPGSSTKVSCNSNVENHSKYNSTNDRTDITNKSSNIGSFSDAATTTRITTPYQSNATTSASTYTPLTSSSASILTYTSTSTSTSTSSPIVTPTSLSISSSTSSPISTATTTSTTATTTTTTSTSTSTDLDYNRPIKSQRKHDNPNHQHSNSHKKHKGSSTHHAVTGDELDRILEVNLKLSYLKLAPNNHNKSVKSESVIYETGGNIDLKEELKEESAEDDKYCGNTILSSNSMNRHSYIFERVDYIKKINLQRKARRKLRKSRNQTRNASPNDSKSTKNKS